VETNFDLSVKDGRGNVIGYRCINCSGVLPAMWANICNECRDKERRHRELIAAIRQESTDAKGD